MNFPYLMKPYPMVGNRWRIILPVFLFVCVFMIVFQPFGLSELAGDTKFLYLSGYGLVTLLILVMDLFFLPLIFPRFFKEESWTTGKEILILLWILFSIGLGNLGYTHALLPVPLSLRAVLIFQGFTLAIGLIPVTTLTLVKQSYLDRKHRKGADKLSDMIASGTMIIPPTGQVTLLEEGGRESMVLQTGDLIAIRADGNYISVFHFAGGKPTRTLLRSTLTVAGKILATAPSIFRCHRSFLVNTVYITQVKGNSQGYSLVMAGMDQDVPVSRPNATRLREILNS